MDTVKETTAQTDRRRRLVVKIGSSTLTTSESSIDYEYLDSLSAQIADLREEGWDVVIVSSGAIASGLEALGIKERPKDMPHLQAAASVGQSALSAAYAKAFARFDITTSLVLLTRRDTADREAYLHARDTLSTLLEMSVVPIVNENDTVSVEQIRFGDNDTLAALVACLVDADLMVILSDIDGLYDANPQTTPTAKLVSEVKRISRRVMDAAGGAGSVAGSGGMITKIRAARVLMSAAIPMMIVNGRSEGIICAAARGEDVGTRFISDKPAHEITPRKLWLALGDSPRGAVFVDEGARRALIERGSSLLCVGITRVDSRFDADDVIDVKDAEGIVIARGRAGASSDEIELACGRSSEELDRNRILSRLAKTPVVHRDELVLFE
ncbi:MAG: glutamate 5-kinase [Eggerthellaceae bacterium]|nr:glutamate 5-kinase [Eggerthellaceae bacterium]